MKLIALAETFDREDFLVLVANGQSKAAIDPSPIRQDSACAALAMVATFLCACKAEVFSKRIEQGHSGAMLKIKRERTADCVVGGFRYASKGKVVGSLLLGLYDKKGLLNHVGFTSAIAAAERKPLTRKLEAVIKPPGFTGRTPGGLSRWSTKRSMEWEPLDPVLVVEVQFDHFTGGRFRHGTSLLRWRPDKNPRQCTMAQVRMESRSSLNLL